MTSMRSITACAIALLLAGCATPKKYGVEQQLSFNDGSHPVWAVAPAINLSGQPSVDPVLQADLLFTKLHEVDNLTLIPVNRVVQVLAALHLDKIESEDQAALVCQQLGCDALVIPTITLYDPYNPPKVGISLQLLRARSMTNAPQVDARQLARMATPSPEQTLDPKPSFMQAVGMYDAANGSVRQAVMEYANGRNDPVSPMASNEFFLCMDSYCGFAYHTLIVELVERLTGKSPVVPVPVDPKTPTDPFTAWAESTDK